MDGEAENEAWENMELNVFGGGIEKERGKGGEEQAGSNMVVQDTGVRRRGSRGRDIEAAVSSQEIDKCQVAASSKQQAASTGRERRKTTRTNRPRAVLLSISSPEPLADR